MAKILKGTIQLRRGQSRRYPWDDWLDGKLRELRRGVDYDCITDYLRSAASNAAKKRNMRVSVSVIDNETVHIQAYNKQ